jgi:hypothetical protein
LLPGKGELGTPKLLLEDGVREKLPDEDVIDGLCHGL